MIFEGFISEAIPLKGRGEASVETRYGCRGAYTMMAVYRG
jgi:hypothetical protein